ncbi:Phosphotransferase enzyme family protein [Methylobacterium sp. 190mf]|nr:Phosphotransferase enzyme family protein [Methylobacterium sp. 190mf]
MTSIDQDPPDVSHTVIELRGHSGCRVEVARERNSFFVRKTSGSIDYNRRLSLQIEKQARLRSILPVAEIYKIHSENGLLSYDMEFLNGRDFRSQCLEQPISWVGRFTEQLLSSIHSLSMLKSSTLSSSAFHNKIASISGALRSHPRANEANAIFDSLICYLRQENWTSIPQTECHGDLTLENLIFQIDGAVYFIDLLDSDLDSIWLDFAKILFDLEAGWSLRHHLSTNTDSGSAEVRLLRMVSRYLYDEILAGLGSRYPNLVQKLTPLKILQAARIIPYTHDDAAFECLISYIRAKLK